MLNNLRDKGVAGPHPVTWGVALGGGEPEGVYLRSGPTPEEVVLLAVSEDEELVVDALLACGFRNCRCRVMVIVKIQPHQHESGFTRRHWDD